jgi:hypothetical protein
MFRRTVSTTAHHESPRRRGYYSMLATAENSVYKSPVLRFRVPLRPWKPTPNGGERAETKSVAKDFILSWTGSVVIYWLAAPWLDPWGCGKLLPEPGEAMYDSVREHEGHIYRHT